MYLRQLHDCHMPQWITSNQRIESSEFTAEDKTWLSIICSWVIPSRNETDVSLDKATLVCAIMEGLEINVNEIIVLQIQEVVIEVTKSI